MGWIESLRVAIRALRANALRSALAMLGIVIGVAAVIAMVALGGGAHGQVVAQIRSLGANLLIVTPGSAREGGARLGAGTRETLTEDDAAAIVAEVPSVRVAAPAVDGSAHLVRGNQNWSTAVVGAVPAHFEARDWQIASGSLFTAREVEDAAKIAVLGATVAERVLGRADPTGAALRINDVPFQVAGVLARKGNDASGRDQDDVVFVPLSTAKLRLLGGRRRAVDFINVEVASAEAMADAQRAIEALLRQRHRLAPDAPDDFRVRNMTTAFEVQAEATRSLALLLAAVAAVSLVAGGINVMNVMLVAVTERTREVGLRLAVGARARDVRNQFRSEATSLCLLGGLAGVVLGIGAALALATSFGWAIRITLEVVLLAMSFAAAVGIGSGLYPAVRASRLDPIEALRFE